MLSSHYRKPFDFSEEEIIMAKSGYERFTNGLQAIKEKMVEIKDKDTNKEKLNEYAFGKDKNREFENFLNYHGSKGTKFKNWSLAYNTWIGNAKKFNKKSNLSLGDKVYDDTEEF